MAIKRGNIHQVRRRASKEVSDSMTDLGVSRGSTSVTVTNDTGTDATIPAADVNAGVMTGADRTKLDGIAAGATANSSDSTLLNRANHTGTQAISTVTGLQTALDGKLASADIDTLAELNTVVTDATLVDDSGILQAVSDDVGGSAAFQFAFLAGNFSGDWARVTFNDLVYVGSDTLRIADEAVTNAKLAHLEQDHFKARTSSGTGDVQDVKISDLTEDSSPSWVFTESSGGNMRKTDPADIGGGGSDGRSYNIDTATGYTAAALDQDWSSGLGSWTAVNGSSGTVVITNANGDATNAVYDTSTRTNCMLAQPKNGTGGRVQFRYDAIPADGDTVVFKFIYSLSEGIGNNHAVVGIAFNDNDTSPTSGNYVLFDYDGTNSGFRIQEKGSNIWTPLVNEYRFGTNFYLRISRVGNTAYPYVSMNGEAWIPGTEFTINTYNNTWFRFSRHGTADTSDRLPIHGCHWIKHVANTNVDPF